MAVQLLAGNAEVKSLEELGDVLPANPWIESIDLATIFEELRSVRTEPIHKYAEEFIRCCLKTNPKERMTVGEALKHAWIGQPIDIHPLFRSSEQQTPETQNHRKGYNALVHDLVDVKKYTNKNRPRQKIISDCDVAPAEDSPHFVNPHSTKKVELKFVRISDEPGLTIDGRKSLRKIRDSMSMSQRIEQFGSHGKYGDMS